MRTSQQSQPTGANATAVGAGSPSHGLGSGLGGSAGQRLPVPPRERKPALAALAVLLILGGALISAYLVVQSGQRVSAIAIAQPVSAGERIPENALKSVTVSDTGVQFIRWSERAKVLDTFAAVPLTPDTLLNNNMLTQVEDSAKGRVVLGLSLKTGQIPAEGLKIGQVVALYAVGSGGENTVKPGTLLSADALVQEVDSPSGSSRTGSAGDTGVSVAVLPDQAAAIAQAASAGDVAVALVPPGTVLSPPKGQGQQNQPQGQQGKNDAQTGPNRQNGGG